MWRLAAHKGAMAFAQEWYIMQFVLVPCGSCTGDVISFARSGWTQIQTLKCGCSWEYHETQLRSQQDAPMGEAGACGSSSTFPRHRQRNNSGSGSWDGSARLPVPGDKWVHVALRECHHLLLKVNQVMTLSYSLLCRDLCFPGCIWMQEKWLTPWKMNESRSDLYLATLCLTPCSVWPKPACDTDWSSDSSRYFSFRDKTVTQWIFKSFPCERSALLSKHSAFS